MDHSIATGSVASQDKGDVVFVLIGAGFPWGTASSSRVRMLARCTQASGYRTRVLCLTPSERPGVVENAAVRGVFDGTQFEYTCGSAVRPRSRWARGILALVGLALAARRLRQWRRESTVRAAYLYSSPMTWSTKFWSTKLLLRLLRIPVILDLSERPWALRSNPTLAESKVSLLAGVAGVVAISSFLEAWAKDEVARLGQRTTIARIPILVDLRQWDRVLRPRCECPTVVLSVSPAYATTVSFLAEAMKTVWEHHPGCRLVVTGIDAALVTRGRGDPLLSTLRDPRVRLTGFLPRQRMLEEYGKAWVFAVPLFNDLRSVARFPTKLAEYLACSRPVVASRVGEVERYLTHGRDAFLAEPGDPVGFGREIVHAVSNPDTAQRVALGGLELARRSFHYEVHVSAVGDLVDTVVGHAIR